VKAALVREFGGPECLVPTDVADAVAGHGEVLVRVAACGVNNVDLQIRRGARARLPLPHICGGEVAVCRTVAAGQELLAPTVTRRLIETFLSTSRAPTLEGLTERERQVLELIGQGFSNREIADHFVISEATVKTHVNRVFSKLQLGDRVQAVVLAYESGLVQPRRGLGR